MNWAPEVTRLEEESYEISAKSTMGGGLPGSPWDYPTTWASIWMTLQTSLSFLMRSTHDTLPGAASPVPHEITATSPRPDIALWSTSARVMAELKVPWEVGRRHGSCL